MFAHSINSQKRKIYFEFAKYLRLRLKKKDDLIIGIAV